MLSPLSRYKQRKLISRQPFQAIDDLPDQPSRGVRLAHRERAACRAAAKVDSQSSPTRCCRATATDSLMRRPPAPKDMRYGRCAAPCIECSPTPSGISRFPRDRTRPVPSTQATPARCLDVRHGLGHVSMLKVSSHSGLVQMVRCCEDDKSPSRRLVIRKQTGQLAGARVRKSCAKCGHHAPKRAAAHDYPADCNCDLGSSERFMSIYPRLSVLRTRACEVPTPGSSSQQSSERTDCSATLGHWPFVAA